MGKESIDKVYDPKKVEDRIYQFWLDKNYFHGEPREGKKPYCIVIPPPNVTDRLHMGHAYNNTLQDILIRYKKMQGYETLWMPGTDHAGIATQNVVEKHLWRTEKLTRHDLGREEFVKRVWEWKEKHGAIIINQLKKLGCACDWKRERFTMDEGLSRAVAEVFVRLYQKGLIYRGEYIINWCPRCQTALSDEEVEHRDQEGNLWYINYPLEDGSGHITVATTRPETMLGDVAVAVNPKDERYKALIGKTAILPIIGRKIPIIADDFVDASFGTGAVKVTPAHDHNDFEIGNRHDLPRVNVMHEDGKMNDNAGPYAGQDRYEARKGIVKELEEKGLLEKIEKHTHAIGHCYRCNTVIEPYLSRQWFVKIEPLAKPALQVVRDGKIQFHPERWVKVYINWMENIRDWCISRQLWWGHRIPVFYCDRCGFETASVQPVDTCEKCGGSMRQDPDVLDTWFSSQLWPFSTLGWPEDTPELRYFYPTSTLVTGHEIIFFWVARMIMAGLEFMGDIPFRDVYLHGIIRDAQGRKMSKSLGNGIDPLLMVDRYSADAVRYSLLALSSEGSDINLSERDFEIGRNFANKLWNAFRFLAMNLDDPIYESAGLADIQTLWDSQNLDLADRWILTRYSETVQRVTRALDHFKFHELVGLLHQFFWREYCDWYLELIKPRLYGDDAAARDAALKVGLFVLRGVVRMMHPLIPFITEEIWHKIGTQLSESIMVAKWPEDEAVFSDAAADDSLVLLQELIAAIRNIRGEMNIPVKKAASVLISGADSATAELINRHLSYFHQLGQVDQLTVGAKLQRPKFSATAVVRNLEIFMPLEGLIDIEVERNRLEKEKQRLERLLAELNKKLQNQDFLTRAPKQVVEREEQKKKHFEITLEKIRENLAQLTE
ncbi:MAG: valine--tRNA ligase [candidate division KSB1 bacterium]|nr:valine--tRNA ligase [candidate division KSB1 bacterium]